MKFTVAAIAATVLAASAEAKRGRKRGSKIYKKCSYYSEEEADADKIMGSMFLMQKENADGEAEEALYGMGKWKKNTTIDTNYSIAYYSEADCAGTGAVVGSFLVDSDDTTCDRWTSTELTGYSLADATTQTDVNEAYFGLYNTADGDATVLFCCQVQDKKGRKLDGHPTTAEEEKWMAEKMAAEAAMMEDMKHDDHDMHTMTGDMNHDDHDMHTMGGDMHHDDHDKHDDHDMHHDEDQGMMGGMFDDMWDSATTVVVSGAAMTLAAVLAF